MNEKMMLTAGTVDGRGDRPSRIASRTLRARHRAVKGIALLILFDVATLGSSFFPTSHFAPTHDRHTTCFFGGRHPCAGDCHRSSLWTLNNAYSPSDEPHCARTLAGRARQSPLRVGLALATTRRERRCSSGSPLSATTGEGGEALGGGGPEKQRRGKDRRKSGRRKTSGVANLIKRTERVLALTSHAAGDAKGGEEGAYGPVNDADRNDEQQQRGGGGDTFKVTTGTFNNLLNYWSHTVGGPGGWRNVDAAVSNSERLLARMEDLADADRELGGGGGTAATGIAPDLRSYNSVARTYARSGRRDAGVRAEALIDRMNRRSDSDPAVRPDALTYTAAMEAWASSGKDDAAERAEALLSTLKSLYEAALDEGVVTEGGADVGGTDGDVNADADYYRPTGRSFNAVINAWAKAKSPDSGQRAEAILNDMVRLREASSSSSSPDEGDGDGRYSYLKPNRINFNSVIHAWANSGEEGAAERSEDILERLEALYDETSDPEYKPTVRSFNTVIDAWAKSESEGAAQRAEGILDHMQELYEGGNLDVKPNVRSFNSVLNAWAKSKDREAGRHAEELLAKMEGLYEAGRDAEIQPDVHSFSTVINAWGRSFSFGKAERARGILRHMRDLYQAGNAKVRPNVVIYNSVMNACAFTVGDEAEQGRAMEIAHETFRELEQSSYGNPDQVTYGTFLKACANQMPASEARTRVVEAIFRKCCKDGQVGDLVLRELQSMATPEFYRELIGRDITENISTKDLPKEWRCNVTERRTQSYNRTRRRQF